MIKLAKATNGSERINLTEIWNDLPRQSQVISIGHWLLLVAVVLILLEVLERRTGLLSGFKWKPLTGKIRIRRETVASPKRPKPRKARKARESSEPEPDLPTEPPAPEKKAAAPGLLSALSKAQRSAKARTDRKG